MGYVGSTSHLGDPIFAIETVMNKGFPKERKLVRVVTSEQGLKAALKSYKHPPAVTKVYICPDPEWLEWDPQKGEVVE